MKWRLILLVLTLFLTSIESEAQTKRRKREVKKEKQEEEKEVVPFAQKIAYDIRVGTPSFGNGFSLSIKPSVGYKFHDRVTGGLGFRSTYTLINYFQAPDLHLFDYGAFAFGRFKIGQSFYLQGEYSTMSYDFDDRRFNVNFPSAGAGYMSGVGDWSYGIEFMIPLSENARDFGPSFEYNIIFSYRF